MFTSVLLLIISLIFILVVCGIFTNAVEWFGKVLNLSHGVTGSILAAVGTALPETIIPIIAIIFSVGAGSDQIGIGAIAGAPFMLATLGFFVTGSAVLVYSALKKRSAKMHADYTVFVRDLSFFVIVYGIAILTTFFRSNVYIKGLMPIVLLLMYILYIKMTFEGSKGHEEETHIDDFYLSKFLNVKPNLFWIIIELLLALAGIVFGSHLFVSNVEIVSENFGIAPLILSMLITPIATELPEKFNSILWIGKRKDTLALGNMTGAMVFQSCFPVAIGIWFTPWNLTGVTMVSALLALFSGFINLVWIKTKKSVNPYMLLSGGGFYLVFLFYIIFG